jgi:hypothetical protein
MKDMGDVIILTKAEYESLQRTAEKYHRLEAYGVDNWSGYSDAMTDSEGIFEEE